VLRLLGYSKVKLMTNNPTRCARWRRPASKWRCACHSFPDNAHNRDYLRVKAEKGGHLL
jgi:GTP cyclohydrolase II